MKWICVLFINIAALTVEANQQKTAEFLNRNSVFDEIVLLLQVYNVFDETGPMSLRRIGRDFDGGYIVPEQALKCADAIVGYGINDDISFEETASTIYQKPSYGFDGTCKPISPRNRLCHFISQNIVSDKYLRRHHASAKRGTFNQQIERLHLIGHPIFVKMDIESNEYPTMPDILQHADNITGIVIEIHVWNENLALRAINLLKAIDQDFILIHVHGNNFSSKYIPSKYALGTVPCVLELSYINRKLVHSSFLANNQNHPISELDMPNDPSRQDCMFTILSR